MNLAKAQTTSGSAETFHFSADSYRTNFETKVTHAEGNIQVVIGDKTIKSDTLVLDAKNSVAEASGNVELVQGSLRIKASQMTFNVKTGLGVFKNAVVRVGNSLYLEGRELERYQSSRYKILHGKVSTCMDCPQAWSVVGSHIDVEIEGYAEIHHALFEIKDAPIAYFPIIFLPVKSKRQSGFLIPELASYPDIGFSLRQPYFFALSPSSDATLEAQQMTQGGQRAIFEYRNLFSDRSYVMGKTAFGQNAIVPGVPDHRFGYRVDQRQQLGPRWVQRFRGELASDSRYAQNFYTDFESSLLPSLQNEFSLLRQDSRSVFLTRGQFHSNNIPRDPDKTPSYGDRGPGPLHQAPYASLEWPALSLGGPVLLFPRFEHANYIRRGPGFDPQTEWLRTGNRSTAQLLLNAPTNLGILQWTPSLLGRFDFYKFPTSQNSQATRRRLVHGQELDLELWRVYKTSLWEEGAIRHSLKPFVRYSQTTVEEYSDNKFFTDLGSPKFDLFDPGAEVPEIQLGTVSEEQKLRRHHFVSFGASTRLISRIGPRGSASYNEFFSLSAERDYNFILQDFGRIRASAAANWGMVKVGSQLSYDPKQGNRDQQNSLEFNSDRIVLGATQLYSRTKGEPTKDKESYSGKLEIKNVGPWSAYTTQEYDSVLSRVTARSYGISYLSPSNCWMLGFKVEQIPGVLEKYSWKPLFNLVYKEQIKSTKL